MLHRSTALLFAMLFGGVCYAAPQGQSSRFRAEAELVTVDVVVLDKRGQSVEDLTAGDFTVSEDGRPQTVRFFQPVVTTELQPETGTAGARAYRYSTNVGLHARASRSFVLFFDDVHLTTEQGERAKRALKAFLTEEAHAGDLVSLVAPARGLRWHARLPGGREQLLQALASLRGEQVPEAAAERISDYEAYRIHVMQDEQMAERVGRRFSNFGVAGRDAVNLQKDQGPRPETKGGTAGLLEPLVQARAAEAYARAAARNSVTLGALALTVEGMAPVRGRKALIMISPGFILDQERILHRQVEDAARRANIAMYFVDARGLEAQSGFASAEFGSPLDSRDVGAATADLALEAEGAASLAESSGGFSVRNRNDLAAGLGRIARESQGYYLLSYMPRDTRRNGRFRRISVRVQRPDVHVRARRGYYAGDPARPSGPPAEPSDREMRGRAADVDPLEIALDSPYDLSAVPVRAAAYVFGKVNAKESSVLLAAEVDLRAFELEPAAGGVRDVLDLRMLVTNPATGETKRYERAVEMTLESGVATAETSAWYPLSQPFDLAPGRYQARVAVKDRNSGRVGSVTHDFEVPSQGGLAVSSVIVTDTIETPMLGFPGPPRPVLIVRRLFSAGRTLYYQFGASNAERAPDGAPRVTAGHVVRTAEGAVVKELKPTPLAPGPTGMSRFAGISLAGIPPGDYELVVSVTDEVRGETVTVREPFAIAATTR